MKKRSPTKAAPRRAALTASRARTTSIAARRAQSRRARPQAKPAPGRKSSKK